MIWSIEKKNQKRRKWVKTSKFMTPIHRWFSGRKPEVTSPKLTFSRSNRHDCPVQPIESSADMPKLVIISRQSKKKWHLEGKKIHPGKIPLYIYINISNTKNARIVYLYQAICACISLPGNVCKYIFTWQGQPLLPPQWFPQGFHAPCVPGISLLLWWWW